ncbi:MAG: hypothetical protein RR825_06215, partial [Ruthenibacterium sp.]
MKNFKGFCRRVLFPLLLAVLVLSAWYFTRVLPEQSTSADSAAASSVQGTSPDSANSAAIDESESYTAR